MEPCEAGAARATAACTGQTGVEMEALTACSVALPPGDNYPGRWKRGMNVVGY